MDKPLIQYAVEEALSAGITEMIFVTGRNKRAIEDHFDKAYELETELAARNNIKTLELIKNMLPKNINCVYTRQAEALGLGHAVLCAKQIVGDEPFAVLLADDLIDAQTAVMKQMTDVFNHYQSAVLAVENVPLKDTNSYGIVDARPFAEKLERVHEIVEKPYPETTPSTLAVVGRYILSPRIFRFLEQTAYGKGGELQLTDAISAMLKEEQVLAYRYDGARYDCGSKFGYLQASIVFGEKHAEIGNAFRFWLTERQLQA